METIITKVSRVSRRLLLAGVCATSVCIISCTSPSAKRAAHKAIVEKKMNTIPTISWEEHLEASKGSGLWLGTEQYIVYPEVKGKCLRARLYKWNYQINKYIISKWVLDHEYKDYY